VTSLSEHVSWLGKQSKEIQEGGLGVLARKTRNLPIKLINGLWAIPVVLLIRALRPALLIRMGTLNSGRIGHFVADGAEQLARLQQQPTNTVDWFWIGETCNSQWESMIRRSLPVHSWVKYLDWWNRALPGGFAHMRPSSYTQSRDVEGLYARYDVKIPFLPAESEEALAWLRSKGWSDGEPFVCLLVRDAEFLANDPIYGTTRQRARLDWSYHDYRDSDIDTYLPAIQWLAEQGVWVIRMGKLMAKPLPIEMDHVIDYTFDPDKSDLLDIWLFAKCTACISTGTGLDQLAFVYDRPLLFVNFVPLGYLWSFCNMTIFPKTLVWRPTGEPLSACQHLEHGSTVGGKYAASGVLVVEMTSAEILSAVQEFWHRLHSRYPPSSESRVQQERFWSVLQCWTEFDILHKWRHPQARLSPEWLRKADLALPLDSADSE